MRLIARVTLWFLVLAGSAAPWRGSGPARAAAPTGTVTIAAITVPGVSPLAGLVNRAGTRAMLAGLDISGRVVFLLYDARSRRLLHRERAPATLGGESLSDARSLGSVLDERRGRAYFFLLSSIMLTSVVCVVDLSSGRLLGANPVDDGIDPATPIVEANTGALWYIGAGKGGKYLAHTGPNGATAGSRHFPLPDSVEPWSAIWLDPARNRVIVGTHDGDFLGFDLSGHKIWTIATFINSAPYAFGTGRLYDPATGNLWVEDPLEPMVSVTSVSDGRQHRMTLGAPNNRLGGLIQAPGGIFVVLSTDQAFTLVRLGAAPLVHKTATTYTSDQIARVFERMLGPAALNLKLTPILGLPGPGTLPAYYLTYQQGDADSLRIVNASRLSRLDWQAGKLGTPIRLPVAGTVIAPLGIAGVPYMGPLDRGFYQVLGTGRYNANYFTWGGTALLLVTAR
jgi:hypothetical protein